MNNGLEIIQIKIDDIPRLSFFLAKHTPNYGEAKWKNILEWIWLYNPQVNPGETNLGWGITDAEQHMRGFIGNIPVQYFKKGELCSAIWGTSWYVDNEAKELSLKLYIHFTRQKEMIFSNSQTEKVEVVMKKLGFEELQAQWFEGSFLFSLKIFNTGFFSEICKEFSFKKTGVIIVGILLKILQSFLFTFFRNKKSLHEIELRSIIRFPESTDQWVEEFSREKDCTWARNRQSYEWLFCHPSSSNDFLKYQVLHNSKMLGFIIFKKKTLKGFHYIEIIDEALLPLSDTLHKQVLLKSIFVLNKEVKNANFLIIRSNLTSCSSFFKSFLGLHLPVREKGYLKVLNWKPESNRSIFTSVDGDIVFF